MPLPKDLLRMSDKDSKEEKISSVKREDQDDVKPVVIMSELDVAINARIKSQPKEIDHIDVPRMDPSGYHRLSLPEYFEPFSYDCTRGEICMVHRKGEKGQTLNRGKYVFRWLFKNKRSIDTHLDTTGWYLVNQSGPFGDAPRELFEVSGGVERGDSILAFMPLEKALKVREYPAIRSQEFLRSRLTVSRKDPRRVLMTGNPDQEHIYEPEMGNESEEDTQRTQAPLRQGAIEVD